MPDHAYEPYHYARSIEAEELRILTLLPGETDAEFHGELEISRRQDKPEYTALSYCWGPDIQELRGIHFGPQTLRVKEELAKALQHLRHVDQSRKLWIDAICIIQEENEMGYRDKNAQISKMDEIYSEAADVIVWLGEADDHEESGLAMAAINVLGEQLDNLVPLTVPGAPLEFVPVNGCEPRRYILAIQKLLRRSWFHRLWTIQEVCLAPRKVTFMCGSAVVPFWKFMYLQLHPKMLEMFLKHTNEDDDGNVTLPVDLHRQFARGLEPPIGLTRHFFLFERKRKSLGERTYAEQRSLFTENESRQLKDPEIVKRTEKGCTLISLLWHFRFRECTKQRDRVYAFLGMMRDIPKQSIEVRVEMGANFAFREATCAIIRENKRLDILGMCFAPSEEDSTKDPKPASGEDAPSSARQELASEEVIERPSWVPNLEFEASPKPFVPLTHYGWSGRTADSKVIFRATKDSLAAASFSDDRSKLIVKGRQIGVIKDSGYGPFKDNVFTDDGSRARDAINALLHAREVAKKLKTDTRDTLDEFWRTLITNRGEGGGEASHQLGEQFNIWWEMLLGRIKPTIENQARTAGFAAAFNQHYFTRDFFITDQEQMGLCGLTRKMGDLVCLLAGTQVPFVLRREEGMYRIVGECYVHGVMNGELWDESALADFCLI